MVVQRRDGPRWLRDDDDDISSDWWHAFSPARNCCVPVGDALVRIPVAPLLWIGRWTMANAVCRRQMDSVQLADEAAPPPTGSERRSKRRHGRRNSESIESCTGLLKIKYPTGECAISPQPVV